MITGIVLALIQAMTWSSTTILLRTLSTRLDPFLVNGLRAAVGMLVIIPLVFITGGLPDYQRLTGLSLLFLTASVILGGVVGDALYITSLKTLGVSRAFPITNSYPIFTVVFSVLLLGEQIKATTLAGMALVLVGVYLVARPRGRVQTAPLDAIAPQQLLRGVIVALITSALWGLSSTLVALGLRGVNSIVANSVRVPVVVLLSLAVAARRGQLGAGRRIERGMLRCLLLSGLLGWGISGSLYVTAVQLAGPSKTAIVGCTAPLFAVPLSMIFLHERPSRHVAAGTALSVLGVVLVIV